MRLSNSKRWFSHASIANPIISFVTDLEGDYDYWARWVNRSRAVQFDSNNKPTLLPGYNFVFGGDAIDQANGDLKILEDLVHLKESFPERVSLIMGNRDCNKLRLPEELHPKNIARPELCPRWASKAHYDKFLNSNNFEHNAVSRLKWILAYSMGAGNAFEFRRQSLGPNTSDEDVVKSFVDMVIPGGLLFRYLSLAQLGLLVNGKLFLHGGFSKAEACGYVPHLEYQPDAEQWIEELNQFASNNILEFSKDPYRESLQEPWCVSRAFFKVAGTDLNRYAMSLSPTTVYADFFRNDKPEIPSRKILSYLKRNNISQVICGHHPHGDAPLVIRSSDAIFLTADTSYSGNVQYPGLTGVGRSRRGKAVCEVLVGEHQTIAHGVLNNGQEYEYEIANDKLVGLEKKKWWVKGRVGDKYLLSTSEKFNFRNEFRKI